MSTFATAVDIIADVLRDRASSINGRAMLQRGLRAQMKRPG
jgi:hypothetical protein